MMVSLSKRLKQMRNMSARAAVLFVYSPARGRKPMHGQYQRFTDSETTSGHERDLDYGFLKSSNLFAATEGLVVAAQDQALRSRYYERNILHRDVSSTCRLAWKQLTTLWQAVLSWHR